MSDDRVLDDWRSKVEWRESVIREAVRDLAKTGTISAFEQLFAELGKRATASEAIELFRRLQESGRSEDEWKDEFLSLFPAVQESALPEFQNLQGGRPPTEAEPEVGHGFKYPDDIPF